MTIFDIINILASALFIGASYTLIRKFTKIKKREIPSFKKIQSIGFSAIIMFCFSLLYSVDFFLLINSKYPYKDGYLPLQISKFGFGYIAFSIIFIDFMLQMIGYEIPKEPKI